MRIMLVKTEKKYLISTSNYSISLRPGRFPKTDFFSSKYYKNA